MNSCSIQNVPMADIMVLYSVVGTCGIVAVLAVLKAWEAVESIRAHRLNILDERFKNG